MKNTKKGWNPYLAGALSGVVLVLSVWIAGKYFGASTAFVRSAGLIEKQVSSERVAKMDYFVKVVPKIDWQWMFVVGVFVGSLIASTTGKTFQWQALPNMWQSRFGPGKINRWVVAFTGGAIAMFGARLAGG
jgi:hypothetical protein